MLDDISKGLTKLDKPFLLYSLCKYNEFMAYKSLNQFVERLENENELIRVKEFIDPVLEIAEVTDRICKSEGGGKAILFENTGTSFPLLTNAFGSEKRASMALSISSPDEVGKDIDRLFHTFTSPRQGFVDKIKVIPHLAKLAKWLPKNIRGKGVCQQIVHKDPDLSILPILKCWPYDGGRFITLPMVITKDPNNGLRNVGMYRMQVFSKNLTGMHWHRHKTGARHYSEYKKLGELMPVVVALGGDPVYTYSATAPLPDNIDEFLLAGFLRKKRVELVKCLTVELDVPADVDIVIEGYVDPSEEPIWEGPFGDHTGFYSLADWYPKLHVTCITHRKDAIYPATIVGVPPMEDSYLAKITERIFLSPIKLALVPEIVDMALPLEGVAHNIAVVKIDKSYPGQAYKVANALWGAGQMMFNKFLFVVDGDVNLNDNLGVASYISQHFDPLSDILHSKGPLDILDHASAKPGFGGKLVIDATRKLPEEIEASKMNNSNNVKDLTEILEGNMKIIHDFNTSLISSGISLLLISIDKSKGQTVRNLQQMLSETLFPKVILVVDKEMILSNISLVCWYASANIDPMRDCFLLEQEGKQLPCLILDGTRKCYPADNFTREWPNVVTSDDKTIQQVDSKWVDLKFYDFLSSPSHQLKNFLQVKGANVKFL